MKLRAAKLAAGVTGVLFCIIIGLCVGPVDSRPYFNEPFFQRTASELKLLAGTNSLAFGHLKAGFGQSPLIINSEQEGVPSSLLETLPLTGFGSRKGKPAQGVGGPLNAKAMVLRVAEQEVVFVAIDALIVPPEVVEMVVADVNHTLARPGAGGVYKRSQIYFGATHTHCGPGGWGKGFVAEQFAGPYNTEVRQWLAKAITTAIRHAASDLKPASIGFASVQAPEYVRNRIIGDSGYVDSGFNLLVVQQAGAKKGVIGSYAAHATVIPASYMKFNGDYPGSWQQAIEEATSGMAMFMAGAVGSHAPKPKSSGPQGAEEMGRALASACLDTLEKVSLTNQLSLGLLSLDVALPPLSPRLTETLRVRPWLAARLLPVKTTVLVQVLRLGNAVWLSTPCDFSGEISLGIKDMLKAQGFSATVTSFNGDYIGYVVPMRYYHLNHYESRTMSFFGPYMADYLDGLLRDMARELTRDQSPFH